MAKKSNGEARPLELRTLSGNYEAARTVVRVTQIDLCASYDQLKRQLQAIARNPELVKALHIALDRLSRESKTLGITTLVAPLDHPLVTRITGPIPGDKK